MAQGVADAGIACLGMVLAERGVRVGQEELRVAAGVSRDGSTLDSLGAVARDLGFEPRLVDGSPADLSQQDLPAIISWGSTHVRVLESRGRGGFHLVDPFHGRVHVSAHEVRTHSAGPALVVPPADTHAERPGALGALRDSLRRHVDGVGPGAIFVVLAGLGLVIPGLLAPALVRVFVDTYVVAGDSQGARLIVGGLIAATVVTVVLTALQQWGLRRLVTVASIRNGALFVWHVLRMPAWFYAQRDATTLAYRVGLTEQLAEVLSSRVAVALLAQLTSAFYLVLIAVYSPILAALALVGPALSVALMWRIGRLRSEVRQRQAREAAVTATELGIAFRMIETLKATGSEDVAFTRYYASVGRRLTLGVTRLWAFIAMVPVLAITATTSLVIVAGAALVMRGELSTGTLTAVVILLAGFLAPLAVLVPAIDAILNIRGAWEQLGDVLDQAVDPLLVDDAVDPVTGPALIRPRAPVEPDASRGDPPHPPETEADPDEELRRLLVPRARRVGRLVVDPWAADLQVTDLRFGYAPHRPALVDGIDVHAAASRVVALVGASGSGKSTVGRLVTGLYQPWGGSILLDGRPLSSYSSQARARDIGLVTQDPDLYVASVRDNITMFDPQVMPRDVIRAAQDACVHDDIVSRPGAYDADLLEDGRDLSGGQRQRLMIARALVRNPRLLVLDEATSALDARTEAEVLGRIRDRGCTVILISHRLSAVRDADEIVVLDRGAVVQRGRHDSLAAEPGRYRELMRP